MKRESLVTALIVLLAASQLAAVAGQQVADTRSAADIQQVTLTVTVTDGFNSPIKDAKLTAEWQGGQSTATTASNGKAFLDVEKGADVTITVDHAAYTRNNPVTVQDAQEQDVQITVYRKASATVKVTKGDGSPLQGARVLLYKRGNLADRGQTAADGTYDTATIERGDYQLIVVKEGYFKNQSSVTLDPGSDNRFDVRITEGSVTVNVEVVDDHFSPAKPVEGAEISVEGIGTVKTGGNGEQTIALPVNSEFEMTVTKEGYTTKSRTVSVGEGSKSLQFAITREAALDLNAVNQKIVAGEKVRLEVKNEYGEPVEGANIVVDGTQVGTTNAEGVYTATLQEQGTHSIQAKKGGTTSNTVTVQAIEPGGDEATETTAAMSSPGATVPGFTLQIAAAAAGVIVMVLIVRRLL